MAFPGYDPTYVPPPMGSYVETPSRTIPTPAGTPDIKVPGAYGTGFKDRPVIEPPNTYHQRSYANPLGWIGGHQGLRGPTQVWRGLQNLGIIPGAAENSEGYKEPRADWRSTIRNLGLMAFAATEGVTNFTGLRDGVAGLLPDEVRDNIHDYTHENMGKLILAGVALGGLAVARTLRGLPNGAREVLGGAAGDPVRPDFAQEWFGRYGAWGELRNNANSWPRRIGRAAMAGAIGVGANVFAAPIAAFRRIVRPRA